MRAVKYRRFRWRINKLILAHLFCVFKVHPRPLVYIPIFDYEQNISDNLLCWTLNAQQTEQLKSLGRLLRR